MHKPLIAKHFFRWSQLLFGISLSTFYSVLTVATASSIAAPKARIVPPKTRAIYPKARLVNSGGTKIASPGANIAARVRLEDWRFYPEASQLEFTLSAASQPRSFYLAQPSRLVIDLPDTRLGSVATQQNYSGAIQRIRVSQLNANVTRLVMDLAPGTFLDPNQIQLQPVSPQNPTRWVLRPYIANSGSSWQPGNYPQQPSNLPPNPYSNYPQPPIPYNNYPQQPSTQPPIPYNNYPQQPTAQSPNPYNSQQSPYVTQPPPSNNLSPGTYNSNNSQTPFVSVPPLPLNNPSPRSNSPLPPASFPNQGGSFNSPPPATRQGFPVQTVPNPPNSGMVEWGQPIPNPYR
jgi:AMIN domain